MVRTVWASDGLRGVFSFHRVNWLLLCERFTHPPQIQAFIDKVIQCPLQDIEIPLSGFRWEYNKGNFHHWRPLFLHFDTYFKAYISGRNDLLLADDVLEGDAPLPKQAVLQILRVMQIILDNCPNKGSFSGLEILVYSCKGCAICWFDVADMSEEGFIKCDPDTLFKPEYYPLPRWFLWKEISVLPVQWHALCFGLFASIIAPFGGFFASGFKRAFNIKDFGYSIPGHGGGASFGSRLWRRCVIRLSAILKSTCNFDFNIALTIWGMYTFASS